MKKKLILVIGLMFAVSCNNKPRKLIEPINKENPNLFSKSIGINTNYMDLSVRPQDDFYSFVNGKWMEQAEIPSDRGSWGSFNELREYTDSISLSILNKNLEKDYPANSEQEKVNDLYKSFMDVKARNKMGLKPLSSLLNKIQNIHNIEAFKAYLLEQTPKGNNPFYSFYVRPHMKNSKLNAVYMASPSLGMNRDYYQKKDTESQNKIKSYQKHLEKLFQLVKDENPAQSAQWVVDLETAIAHQLLTFENLRDSEKKYNPIAFSELNGINNSVKLGDFFKALKLKTNEVIIPEIAYYKSLDEIINTKHLEALKKYLVADALNSNANYLSTDLEELDFDFYQKELNGILKMRDRDKRALNLVNANLGQAFGKIYVQEVFPAKAKEQAQEMVNYLVKSFRQHIEAIDWMSKETKVKALEKLNKFNVKIGYPDQWKDYSNLNISNFEKGGSLYENMQNIAHWNYQENIAKIGKPVDKTEWFMSPQTVNAYYSPQFNEIVFPAAILQAPFYDFRADAAVNFGGMGAVIGHELSHGFDDSGAKYDGDGNLNNWWTQDDETKFSYLGDRLAAQYSAYEPFEGIHVNGRATLGENIADLGGLNVAYDALQMYLKDHATLENTTKIDGFTPSQRFFISWATIWRTKSKDEALKNQIKTDFHAPGKYRAVGPLENIPAFYKAFNVKKGDKMYKEESQRIKIW